MSQQWLYPIFRFHGYRVAKFETDEHRLLMSIEPQPHKICWLRNLPVGPTAPG